MDLRIPHATRGEKRFVAIITCIVVVFLGAAIWVLANWRWMPTISLVCSIIWLVCLGFSAVSGAKEAGGARPLIVWFLAHHILPHYMRIDRSDAAEPIVRFGCRILHKQLDYLRVKLSGIHTVEWSKGQASAMVGKDMNDWYVVVRFLPKATLFPRPPIEHSIAIIGPCTRKGIVAEFGHTVRQFLLEAGAP